MIEQDPLKSERFVIFQHATGLGSDIYSILSLLYYAEKTSRVLLIDGSNSPYCLDSKKNLVWELLMFKHPVVKVEALDDDIMCWRDHDVEIFDRKTPIDILACEFFLRKSKKKVVVFRCAVHFVFLQTLISRMRSYIDFKLDSTRAKYHSILEALGSESFVGIHIRHGNGETLGAGRDIFISKPAETIVSKIKVQLIKNGLEQERIGVFTDSSEIAKIMFKEFPKSFIAGNILSDVQRPGPLHQASKEFSGAEQALAEMFALEQCHTIICNKSYFSFLGRKTVSKKVIFIDNSDYASPWRYIKRVLKSAIKRRFK